MAIQNPSNLYSGGSAVVNSTPFTQYYLQTKAKNLAKREAIDNYYSQLDKTLTPTGVAADDINDFMDKKSAWERDAMQNKNILNNPRDPNYGEAVTRNRFLFNDAQAHIAASQSRVKDAAEMKGYIKPDHPLTEEAFQELNKLSIAVSKGYQRPDIAKIAYEPKPYGYTEQNKDIQEALKGITLGKVASKVVPDTKTHTNTVTYEFQYSPEALNKIASKGADAYQRNPRIKKMVDETLDNEEHFNVLNPVFKEAYKRDIQSGEDRYTAELLLNAKEPYQQQAVTGYNPFLGQRSSGGSSNGSNGSNPQTVNSNELDRIGNIDPLVFDKAGVTITKGEARDKSGNLYSGELVTTGENLPAGLKAVLKTAGFDFTKANSSFFNLKLKDGQIQAIKKSGGSWIDRQDIGNFQLKANTESAKGQQPQYGNNAAPKTETKKGEIKIYKVGGKEYNQDQINKGAAHYNLTVAEYLKQLGVQ